MKFEVHQVSFTKEEFRLMNQGEMEMELDAFRAAMCGDIGPALVLGRYRHVADIEAENLDQVFEFGNMGPEERITRYLPMHSVSVGDIIVNPEGRQMKVASFGFEEV